MIGADELKEWCDFCDGKITNSNRFNYLFMELFPLTERDLAALDTILSYFSNGSKVIEMLKAIDGRNSGSPLDRETLVEHLQADLREKRVIVAQSGSSRREEILAVIDREEYAFVTDYQNYARVSETPNASSFQSIINDFVLDSLPEEPKYLGIYDAFYGIAYNYPLLWTFMATIVPMQVRFDAYFRLFCGLVDYTIGEDAVYVFE